MALLPATGSEITMGKVRKGYSNITPTSSPNLISNPTNEVIATASEFAVFEDLSPIFNRYGPGVYSISADIKSSIPGSITVYTASGAVEYNIGYFGASTSTVYQRFYFNNITVTRTDPSANISNLSFYGGYGSGFFPSIKNVQVERGPVATAFNPNTASYLSLSATLGPYKGKTAGTAISLSSTFGGATTPYTF
jgi:hypothetical protein